MSLKRKPASENTLDAAKRACRRPPQQSHTTYAIGAASIPTQELSDSDLDIEDCSESLQYLGVVRDQAKDIPWFLNAPDAVRPPASSADENDNSGARFSEGIYIAATRNVPVLKSAIGTSLTFEEATDELDQDEDLYSDSDSSELMVDIDQGQLRREQEIRMEQEGVKNADLGDPSIHPRDAHVIALRNRFARLRSITGLQSGQSTTNKLTALSHSGVSNSKQDRTWRQRLRKAKPSLQLVSAMSESSALHVLAVAPQLLKYSRLIRSLEATVNISAWVWALLSKISDADLIGHNDTSVLRELARAAMNMIKPITHSMGEGGSSDQSEAEDDDRDSDNKTEEIDVAVSVEPRDSIERESSLSDQSRSESPRRERNTSSPLLSPPMKAAEVKPATANESEQLEQRRQKLLVQLEQDSDGEVADPGTSARSAPDPDALDGRTALSGLADMILTIVGEFYGQLDMLDAREALWSDRPSES